MPRFVTAALAAGMLAAACSSGESVLMAGVDQPDETTPPATAEAPTTDDTSPDEADLPADTGGESTEAPPEPATTEPPAPTTTVAPLAQYPPCPIEALDSRDPAADPVEVVFWHGMAAEQEAALIDLADQYNSSQDRVRVELQNQTSYDAAIDKYIQVGQDSRPELIQLPEYSLQVMAQSDTFIPMQACVQAGRYDTIDFLDRVLNAYIFEGIQWSMPFNVSSPILYYNRLQFEDAGLDPDASPITLEDLESTSAQIVGSGAAAFGLVVDSGVNSGGGWFLEQWLGRAGEPYADNGNGRLAPATQVLFDGDAGVSQLTFLQNMINEGLAVWVGDNPGGLDAFLKMIDPAEPAAMTMGSSSALGSVVAALGGGIAPGLTTDDIGVGPMPGPSPVPSAQVGGASLWIPSDQGDEKAAAAWDFVKFLVTAQSQSTWAAATGYVPVRTDALEIDPVKTLYEEDPRYAVAYDQLLARADDITANAPVLGPMREVRAETARATAAIFSGADPATELTVAADRSDALISAYNARN